jgi:hypothetical protein
MATMGHQGLLCMEPAASPHTFNTSSEPYEFLNESVQKRAVILDTNGIRGTRSHSEERTKAGINECGGTIVLNPSPADLDLLLPRILGATEATDAFLVAETLPPFGLLVERVAEQFQYTDCKINRATFRSRAGELLELELDIMALSEIVGTAFPAITPGIATNNDPFVFHEGVITLVSGARVCTEFEISIDNQLRRRFSNSVNATDLTAGDRVVTCKFVTPYTASELDLYAQVTAGSTGTVVFTNGTITTTFTLGVIQFPDVTPTISGKDEIFLTLEGIARKTGSTADIAVTNDSVV